jgi:hypothetical protein
MVQAIPKHTSAMKDQVNTIKALRIEEIESAVELVTISFANDPSVQAILAGTTRSQIGVILKKYVEYLIREGMQYGRVDAMKINKHLAAVMIYFPPLNIQRIRLPSLWSLLQAVTFIRLIGINGLKRLINLTQSIKVARPSKAHYYIELGCVAKGQKHKGIGKQMAQHVFNQADLAGCGVYAETFNPGNIPIMQRLGYKITKQQKSNDIPFWSLWREER